MDPSAPPSPAPPLRLWPLDALRGGCALAVFLSHWYLWSRFEPQGSREHGVRAIGEFVYSIFYQVTWPTGGHHPAVICFFVLSGFCIHFPYEKRAQSHAAQPRWHDYFRRRFWRIVPVYWTAASLGLILVAAEKIHPSGSLLLVLHTPSSATDVAVRFGGLAGLYPREIFAGNYILNTVAVEILMYALYPLFLFLAARHGWRFLALIFVAMYLATMLLVKFATAYWVFNSVFMLGIFWFIGALAAHRFVTNRAEVRGLWVAVGWLAFTALKTVPHFYGLNLIIQLACGLICALGILWLLHRERRQATRKTGPTRDALQFTSRISYSLYAVHTPALMLTTWALLVFGTHESYSLQLVAGLLSSLTFTFVVYYGVERVFYRPQN